MLPQLFAVTAPGFEAVVALELREAGFAEVRVVPGGVECRGSPLQANRKSRIATRFLQRIGTFEARTFEALKQGIAALDRAPFGPGTPTVEVSCQRSRLFHTDAIAERVVEAWRGGEGSGPTVYIRFDQDRCTVSIDTTGEPLFRRGWRLETGSAPLRENLASGLLAFAGWRPGEALYDPMCGSGTFVVEAASWASGRDAGALRSFACEAFVGPEAALRSSSVATVFGASDRSRAVIEAARRNAERAEAEITFTVADASRARPPAPRGLLICNPPYEHRAPGARHAFENLVKLLDGPFASWRALILCPVPEWGLPLLPRVESRLCFLNGGLRVEALRLRAVDSSQPPYISSP